MSDAKRLFFALWPDDDVRRQLAEIARKQLRGKGRLVAPANLHLTLFFLGSVTMQKQEATEVAAGLLRARPISLTLDQLGSWPKPQVAWSGSVQTPSALVDLVDLIRGAMVNNGFKLDTRSYKAHVTLARPVRWEAHDFCLVESITHPDGVEYRPMRRWRLDG